MENTEGPWTVTVDTEAILEAAAQVPNGAWIGIGVALWYLAAIPVVRRTMPVLRQEDGTLDPKDVVDAYATWAFSPIVGPAVLARWLVLNVFLRIVGAAVTAMDVVLGRVLIRPVDALPVSTEPQGSAAIKMSAGPGAPPVGPDEDEDEDGITVREVNALVTAVLRSVGDYYGDYVFVSLVNLAWFAKASDDRMVAEHAEAECRRLGLGRHAAAPAPETALSPDVVIELVTAVIAASVGKMNWPAMTHALTVMGFGEDDRARIELGARAASDAYRPKEAAGGTAREWDVLRAVRGEVCAADGALQQVLVRTTHSVTTLDGLSARVSAVQEKVAELVAELHRDQGAERERTAPAADVIRKTELNTAFAELEQVVAELNGSGASHRHYRADRTGDDYAVVGWSPAGRGTVYANQYGGPVEGALAYAKALRAEQQRCASDRGRPVGEVSVPEKEGANLVVLREKAEQLSRGEYRYTVDAIGHGKYEVRRSAGYTNPEGYRVIDGPASALHTWLDAWLSQTQGKASASPELVALEGKCARLNAIKGVQHVYRIERALSGYKVVARNKDEGSGREWMSVSYGTAATVGNWFDMITTEKTAGAELAALREKCVRVNGAAVNGREYRVERAGEGYSVESRAKGSADGWRPLSIGTTVEAVDRWMDRFVGIRSTEKVPAPAETKGVEPGDVLPKEVRDLLYRIHAAADRIGRRYRVITRTNDPNNPYVLEYQEVRGHVWTPIGPRSLVDLISWAEAKIRDYKIA